MIEPSRTDLDLRHDPWVDVPTAPLRIVEPGICETEPTLVFDETADDWHLDANRRRGEALLARLEAAVARGRHRKAARLRRELLAVIHQDRIAAACLVARSERLPLEPTGRGHVLDRPTLYRLRRTPWHVRPLNGGPQSRLPERTRRIKAAWDAHGRVFDACYEAVEIPEDLIGPLAPQESVLRAFLIGVISPDNRVGDWFVLDRWER